MLYGQKLYRLEVVRQGVKTVALPSDEAIVMKLSAIDYNSRSSTFGDYLDECTVRIGLNNVGERYLTVRGPSGEIWLEQELVH